MKWVVWKTLLFVRHQVRQCKLINDLAQFFLEVIKDLRGFGLACRIFLLICAKLSHLITNLFPQNYLLFIKEVLFWLTFFPLYFLGLGMALLLKSFLFKFLMHLIQYQIFTSLLLLNNYYPFYDDVSFDSLEDFIFLKFYNFLKIEFIYFYFFFFKFFKFLRV